MSASAALQGRESDRKAWQPFGNDKGSNGSNAVVLPREREGLLRAIRYLETMKDNWNGYGAKRPSDLAIRAAIVFVKRLPLDRKHPDKVSTDGQGNITFSWLNEPSERILLTIEGHILYFSHIRADEEDFFSPEIMFDLERIPVELMAHIPLRRASCADRANPQQ